MLDFQENLISVIIPIYNREEYIEDCLHSVFLQTYQNFEIILVDDGSTDNTLKVCQSYAENDKRIKVLTTNHLGVSAARNLALENSKGEFIFFIDSDDVIYPSLFKTFIDNLKITNAQIAGTRKVGVDNENWHKVMKKISEKATEGEVVFANNSETVTELLETGNSPFVGVGGVMIRRDLIQNTRFLADLTIGEDFYFLYENIIKGASSITLKQKWYYSRHHSTNATNDVSFSAFNSKFYRRVLVWKSEEKLGRKKYSKLQKNSAVYLVLSYVKKYGPFGEDAKKVRALIKQYKGEIYPALSIGAKTFCFLFVNFPFLLSIPIWFLKIIKK